jgi:hypothetical protein
MRQHGDQSAEQQHRSDGHQHACADVHAVRAAQVFLGRLVGLFTQLAQFSALVNAVVQTVVEPRKNRSPETVGDARGNSQKQQYSHPELQRQVGSGHVDEALGPRHGIHGILSFSGILRHKRRHLRLRTFASTSIIISCYHQIYNSVRGYYFLCQNVRLTATIQIKPENRETGRSNVAQKLTIPRSDSSEMPLTINPK